MQQMRLGKTLNAIRWAANKPVNLRLIVAPLLICYTWSEELSLEGFDHVLLTGNQEERQAKLGLGIHRGVEWYVINPEGLYLAGHKNRSGRKLAVASEIATFGWPLVIWDESTNLRNPQAILTQVATQELVRKAQYRACLSGQPTPENLLDLYGQFRFVFGSCLGSTSYWRFRNQSFQRDRYDFIPKPGVRDKLREEVRTKCYRLLRSEVGLANTKLVQRRFVELPDGLVKKYKAIERDWAIGSLETNYAITRHNWLTKFTGGTLQECQHNYKATALMDLLTKELLEEKVVVWFRYNTEIELVKQFLQGNKMSFGVLTGAVKPDDRQAVLSKFREKNGTRILLVQAALGKMGLNLAVASVAIYYSLYWSSLVWEQSQDRIEHPSKKEPLHYIVLTCRNTLDVAVVDRLGEKSWSQKALFKDIHSALRKQYASG